MVGGVELGSTRHWKAQGRGALAWAATAGAVPRSRGLGRNRFGFSRAAAKPEMCSNALPHLKSKIFKTLSGDLILLPSRLKY